MTGLFIIALGLTILVGCITINALVEDFRVVRSWRKDHGR